MSHKPSSLGDNRWLLIIGMSRIMTTAVFMTYAAVLPILISEWQLSGTEAGAIQSSFSAAFAVSLFATSWASDYFGAARVFFTFTVSSAIAGVLFAFGAQGFWSAFLLHALVGAGQGGTYTPAIMLVSQHMPANRLGTGLGRLLAAQSLGYILSLCVAASVGFTFGYRAAFFACAIGPFFGALAGAVAVRTARPAAKVHTETHSGSALGLVKNRDAGLLTIGYTAHCWELFGFWAWTPAFLVAAIADRSSMSTVMIGVIIAISIHFGGFSASAVLGEASDRFGRRAVLILCGAVGATCSFIYGWLDGANLVLLFSVTFVYGFFALGDSAVLSAAMGEAVPKSHLGRALGVRSILGIGAGAAAPVAFGYVLDLSNPLGGSVTEWRWAYSLLGVGGAVATLCAWLLPERSTSRSGR